MLQSLFTREDGGRHLKAIVAAGVTVGAIGAATVVLLHRKRWSNACSEPSLMTRILCPAHWGRKKKGLDLVSLKGASHVETSFYY